MNLTENLRLKDLMTVAQASDALECSRQNIHERMQSGSLRSIQFGHIMLVLKHDVNRIVRKRRRKGK